jgi:hypothetical protein
MKEPCKGQEHHFTNSKVLHAHIETEESLTQKTKQCGSNAQVFNLTQQFINQWTASPLPTAETWIKATEQDPNLRLPLTRAMKEKMTPLKDKLIGQ